MVDYPTTYVRLTPIFLRNHQMSIHVIDHVGSPSYSSNGWLVVIDNHHKRSQLNISMRSSSYGSPIGNVGTPTSGMTFYPIGLFAGSRTHWPGPVQANGAAALQREVAAAAFSRSAFVQAAPIVGPGNVRNVRHRRSDRILPR